MKKQLPHLCCFFGSLLNLIQAKGHSLGRGLPAHKWGWLRDWAWQEPITGYSILQGLRKPQSARGPEV